MRINFNPLGILAGILTLALILVLVGIRWPITEDMIPLLEKTAVSALVAALIVNAMIGARSSLRRRSKEIEIHIESLQKSDEQMAAHPVEEWFKTETFPTNSAIQTAVKRARFDTTLEGAEAIAISAQNALLKKVEPELQFGSVAVYFGLAGTIIGLTFAVASLAQLASDTHSLQDRILGVISGFGGTFCAALAGILATTTVGRLANRYQALSTEYSDELTSFLLTNIFAPRRQPDNASVLRTAIEQSMAQSLGPMIALALREETRITLSPAIAKTLGTAVSTSLGPLANELATQRALVTEGMRIINDMAKSVILSASEAKVAAQAAASSAKEVHGTVSSLIQPIKELKTASLAVKTITETLGDLSLLVEPLTSNADKLATVTEELGPIFNSGAQLQAAANNISTFPQRAEGLIHRLSEKLAEHHATIATGMVDQAKELAKVAESVRSSVSALDNAINGFSEVIYDMPMSVASTRLVEEMRSAAQESRNESAEDVRRIDAAMSKLEEAEAKIAGLLLQLRLASDEAQNRLKEIEALSETTRVAVSAVEERLRQPIVKRLFFPGAQQDER